MPWVGAAAHQSRTFLTAHASLERDALYHDRRQQPLPPLFHPDTTPSTILSPLFLSLFLLPSDVGPFFFAHRLSDDSPIPPANPVIPRTSNTVEHCACLVQDRLRLCTCSYDQCTTLREYVQRTRTL